MHKVCHRFICPSRLHLGICCLILATFHALKQTLPSIFHFILHLFLRPVSSSGFKLLIDDLLSFQLSFLTNQIFCIWMHDLVCRQLLQFRVVFITLHKKKTESEIRVVFVLEIEYKWSWFLLVFLYICLAGFLHFLLEILRYFDDSQ